MQIFNFNRKSKEAASDFWMADSYAMKTRKRDEDVMELSSYRRAVANFVRIVTGDNIPVKYHTGDDSSTNGKIVTISASTKLEERDVMVGLALHEGSHIKLTDFKQVNELFGDSSVSNNVWLYRNGYRDRAMMMCKDFGSQDAQWDRYAFMRNFKDIFNYVEDRRIDNFVMTQAPGYMPYYQALYDKYFNSAVITKGLQSKDFRTEQWESYMFRLMNITNPASDLKALKKLQQIWDVLDLEHIDRLQNSNDSLALAFNITETIHNAIADQKKKEQEQQQQQDGDGNSKDDKKKDNKSQKDTKGDAKDSKSTDKNSKSDDESDPMSSDADGEDSEGGDSSESDKESKSKGNDKKEKKKESSEDESDSEDDSEDQGEGEEDDSEGSGGVGDNEDEESDDQSDEGDSEEGEGEGEEEKELPELSKADAGRLVKQIAEQKQFQAGQIGKKKLSKGTADTVNAIDDSDIAIADVNVAGNGFGASGSTEKVVVIRKFNRKLAETTSCGMWYNSPNRSHADAVADGIRMGTVLGKKLKVRAEERSTKFNRLRSGKIDKRMISQAGYGAEGIFEKIESFSYRPGIIHMTIDSSGSMSGSKFKRSLTCAAAIAKACSMIENMDCVISFRSTGSIGGKSSSDAMVVVAYDSTRQSITDMKTLLPYISANGGTPEGLCFDALMNDILGQAKGKDAYFVNFSDGQPYHGYNYHGMTAVQHTRKQVNKMITNGMKVISYFISEYSASKGDSDTFRNMYGKDAQFIDVKSINAVAKTMNDKFLEIK